MKQMTLTSYILLSSLVFINNVYADTILTESNGVISHRVLLDQRQQIVQETSTLTDLGNINDMAFDPSIDVRIKSEPTTRINIQQAQQHLSAHHHLVNDAPAPYYPAAQYWYMNYVKPVKEKPFTFITSLPRQSVPEKAAHKPKHPIKHQTKHQETQNKKPARLHPKRKKPPKTSHQPVLTNFNLVLHPGSLRSNLIAAGHKAGWQDVIWQAPIDFHCYGTRRLHGDSLASVFLTALKPYPLQAIFYRENHVIIIRQAPVV